ncbi:MAG: 50S ribosomal protein L6 [Chlamydiia bacterium]|nr:50S ribosomal protein L6 [Chlamydiia bacterium]
MSRLAKKPAILPKGVQVSVSGREITVKGPKGTISYELNDGVNVEVSENEANIIATDELSHKPFLGLEKSRLINSIIGVTEEFTKVLELVGVGYRAAVKGKILDLSLGFSHPCELAIPEGLKIAVEKNTVVKVTGVDKALVGQFSATIRSKRPPEPYKGKGVKYQGEYIRRKAGKKAK